MGDADKRSGAQGQDREDDISVAMVREAVSHFIDLACCWEQRGRRSDPEADDALRQVVELLRQHQNSRRRRDGDAVMASLVEDLAEIYRTFRASGADTVAEQRAEIVELFDFYGLSLADDQSAELIANQDEIRAEKGPVACASAAIGRLLKVSGRTVITRRKRSRTENPVGIAPTGWGRRTGVVPCVAYVMGIHGVPSAEAFRVARATVRASNPPPDAATEVLPTRERLKGSRFRAPDDG